MCIHYGLEQRRDPSRSGKDLKLPALHCVLDIGAAYCWEKNDDGQMGNGTNNPSAVPVRVDDPFWGNTN